MVGDDRVRFVKFDNAAEFVAESALEIHGAWILAFSVNHHGQTGPVEQGNSIHQDSMRTVRSYASTTSVLWAPQFLLTVELHSLELHAGAAQLRSFHISI
jgi:hypothetical protein